MQGELRSKKQKLRGKKQTTMGQGKEQQDECP